MSESQALSITTPTDLEVVMTRGFHAPRELVWKAITEPPHLTRWMLGPPGWSMPVCEVDLRPGGGWHFVWRKEDGEEMEMRGEYREVTPPDRLVHTERWGGDWAETVVTQVLTESDGETTLAATILYPTKEERDRAIATGMADGAATSYDRMDDVLRSMAQGVRA